MTIPGYQSMTEIETTYPDQWVILDPPKADRWWNILGGRVVFSTESQEELDAQLFELDLSSQVGIIHTSNRPFRVVGRSWWERVGASLTFWVIAVGVLVGVAWVSHRLTVLGTVPSGVRMFDDLHPELEAHATAVREGRITPEPDPNGITRYPLPEALRSNGVLACTERGGLLWYLLPSHPLDGGSPYFVTPLDPSLPVMGFPNRISGSTYQFRYLRGKWAYWFHM